MNQPIDLLDQSVPASKTILLLAWPTVVEQILQTLVNYVDTAMVGSLGANATAAIAINNSMLWLINGLMNAAALGFSVQVARYLGLGSQSEAKKIIRQAMLVMFWGGLGVTLLMELLSGFLPVWLGAKPVVVPHAINYLRIVSSVFLMNMAVVFCGSILRCAGDTKTPLFFNILTNLLNILGNTLLIFPSRQVTLFNHDFYIWGAGWGVEGAAIATALAGTFSGLMLLRAIYFKKSSPIRISFKDSYQLDRGIMKAAWSLGSPAGYERIVLSMGQLGMTGLVAGLGTVELAAYHLSNTAEAISYLPGFGFSVAATTLVAQSLGAGEKDLAHSYSKLCVRYGVIMMGIAGLLMFVFSRPLIALFSPDPEVIALGAWGLKVMALSEPFFALSIVITGILRGAGDTKWPFYITAIGMWGIRVGAVFLLCYPFGLGVYGAWIGMILDIGTRGLLSLWRFRSNKWLQAWAHHGN